MKLEPGMTAPLFTAKDQNGEEHSLQDYRGKKVFLYFYPKDDTPGCTKEACGVRDNFQEIAKEVVVLGVSKDSVASHKHFAEKYHLPFTLLSDEKGEILEKYGTDGTFFPKRTSFIISEDGVIEKVYEKVKPEEHATEILQDLAAL